MPGECFPCLKLWCRRTWPNRRGSSRSGPTETLIFVDVDGVLNVGVFDQGNAPVAFNQTNLQLALKLEGQNNILADRIRSVAGMEVEGEHATYEKFVAEPCDLSQLLVGRLAQLIGQAGSSCSVVLSSSWRKPKHAKRVQTLETFIGKHLGRPFQFDDRTELREESGGAMDRLQVLGDYTQDFCRKRRGSALKLRVLVLEDFCITPLDGGLKCQGVSIGSPEAAERYLLSRAKGSSAVSVRMIHTYDKWITDQGLPVAIGTGLTMKHFSRALQFLDGMSSNSDGHPSSDDGHKLLERHQGSTTGLGCFKVSFMGWALKYVRSQ
mmetsp:Transcript_57967/g.114958  ORF Transcript_57967/g.114958 Transcript_57967/m.114958 type:complete len:323 (+) Transcript_57967:87-1055(+)